MNIIDSLVSHHGELRSLYRRSLEEPAAFDQFVRHLTVHHTMEEKYFYDLLVTKAQGRRDALEAVNEHHIIELLIQDSSRFPRDHEMFAVKVEGLGEYTTHHLDEEEADIFPAARSLFSPKELEILGGLFLAAKDNLLRVEIPPVPERISPARPGGAAAPAAAQESAGQKGAASSGSSDLGIGSLKR